MQGLVGFDNLVNLYYRGILKRVETDKSDIQMTTFYRLIDKLNLNSNKSNEYKLSSSN